MKPITPDELDRLKAIIVTYVNAIELVDVPPDNNLVGALDVLSKQIVPRLIVEIERLNEPAMVTREAKIIATAQGPSVVRLTVDMLDDSTPVNLFVTREEFQAISSVDGWMERPVRVRIDREQPLQVDRSREKAIELLRLVSTSHFADDCWCHETRYRADGHGDECQKVRDFLGSGPREL